MDSPIAKIMLIAATLLMVGAVVLVAWNAVASNTPSDVTPDDVSIIKNEALCVGAGGTWTAATKTCA